LGGGGGRWGGWGGRLKGGCGRRWGGGGGSRGGSRGRRSRRRRLIDGLGRPADQIASNPRPQHESHDQGGKRRSIHEVPRSKRRHCMRPIVPTLWNLSQRGESSTDVASISRLSSEPVTY